jgi:TolB-like protein
MRSPYHATARPGLALPRPQAGLARRLAWLLPLFALLGLILAVQARAFWPFKNLPPNETATPTSDATALDANIADLTSQLLRHLGEPDPHFGQLNDGIVVCTFVELKKLTRTSSLGRFLAEQLQNKFAQHGFSVIEIRQTNDILIQEQRGEYALSRDPAAIKPRLAASATLTGTYTLTDQYIFVNARILDARTGTLLTSAATRLTRNAMLDTLLADRASAESHGGEQIYMKRLEM